MYSVRGYEDEGEIAGSWDKNVVVIVMRGIKNLDEV